VDTHEADHYRHYYVTINVTNKAGLVTSLPVTVLVDSSPPTKGVVLENSDSDDSEVR
jgi:hypothetical protein